MGEEIKVVDWISWNDAATREDSAGSIGGFFNWDKKGMRWKDYIEMMSETARPYVEAIRKEVVEKHIKLTGESHQHTNCGVPLFSDGTVACYSYRGWGDLMAAIWSEEHDTDYNYMHFYM